MSDFEVWQKALKKIDMSEATLPMVRGQLLVEDSQVEMYNKIQKLLNSDGMESCHQFLYNLDPLELSEAECMKINNLYKLGQDRGFIESEEDAQDEDEEKQQTDECDLMAAQDTTPTAPVQQPAAPIKPAPQTAFTVVYSAMRDGEIKTGEAYSNSINTRSAKMDVMNKLERAGYSNITILAIEAGDPDACDCCKSETPDTAIPDYATEADDREPLGHALDSVGVKASSANLAGQDAVTLSKISDSEDDIEEDDMLKGRKHNLHIDEAGDEDKDAEEADKADDKDADKDEEQDNKEEDDKEDEKADDKEADKDAEDDGKGDKEEDSEEPDDKLKDDAEEKAEKADDGKDGKELSAAEKESLKDAYKKAFKAAMEKNKFETSFSELSLEQKVKFFETLQKAWGDKADPAEFMTDKETQQLEKIVVKK